MDPYDCRRIDHVLYQRDADERLFVDVFVYLDHDPFYQDESVADAAGADAVCYDYKYTGHFSRDIGAAVSAKRQYQLSGCLPAHHRSFSGDEPAAVYPDLCIFERFYLF